MTEDEQIKETQLDELEKRRQKIREMGGKQRLEVQKQKGKLTARERISSPRTSPAWEAPSRKYTARRFAT